MEKCKCYTCGYSWFKRSNENGHAHQHACPRCGRDEIQFLNNSWIRELQAGASFLRPDVLSMPSGSRNRYKFKKWMAE